MKVFKLMTAAIVALSIASCGEDRTYQYLEYTADCQWIYSTMKEHYLWSDSIKQPKREKFFSKSSDFYKGLLYKEDKTSYYGDSASATSYGFSFSLMRDPLGIEPSRYYALVQYVEPGSPADRAGITRGTWISEIGEKELSASSSALLAKGEATTIGTSAIINGGSQEPHWTTGETRHIDAAMPLTANAIIAEAVHSTDAGKAGYIAINSFKDNDCTGKIADILSQMAAEQPAGIIIDLRYCTTGSIEEAAECASLLATPSSYGKTFCTARRNNSSDTDEYLFASSTQEYDAGRILLLTSSATKGVAEIFIAALQQTQESATVTVIGEPTSGTPLMTETFASPYGFSISPVTAVLYTANGSILSRYSISVDHSINELADITAIYPLGDRRETLLSKALSIIEQ